MFENNNNFENMLENMPIENLENLLFNTSILEEWELLELLETGKLATA